jgi:hypothetical protein
MTAKEYYFKETSSHEFLNNDAIIEIMQKFAKHKIEERDNQWENELALNSTVTRCTINKLEY